MCNSSQFVKECRTLGKIPLDAYLTIIAQFICRESLATHLLWLMVKFYCDDQIKSTKILKVWSTKILNRRKNVQ